MSYCKISVGSQHIDAIPQAITFTGILGLKNKTGYKETDSLYK
jgi:hypothetical protein